MRFTLISLLIAALVPSVSYAATIHSTTESSADTGGNHSSGGTVVTGSSNSTPDVHTLVNGESGGSVHVHTETETNGVVHTENVEKTIAPGEVVDIHVGT